MDFKDSNKRITIEVLSLPHASDFKDFDSLLKEENVDLRYVGMEKEIGRPDLLIIPGTKNTIQDFIYLKRAGYANKIRPLAKDRTVIMGIGGGFQMLGTKIIDIRGSEQRCSKCEGLSFFNIVTRLMPSRIASPVEFEPLRSPSIKFGLDGSPPLSGYEMHLGRTKYLEDSQAAFKITKRDGKAVEILDGAVNKEGNVFGTYIHGIFDNDSFRNDFLNVLRERKGP